MASIRRSAMAVLLAILLSGCAGGKAAQSARETRYFRLASSQSENYVTNQACLRFCDAVRKRSGGSIIIEPYFDSALGQDTQALEQCCFGGVDFARVSATSAAQYAPQLTALQMPYEYTSDEHLFRVLDGKIGRSALDSLEASGLTGITYFYAGYRCFFSAEEVLGSVESMRGLRLRVDESPVMTGLVGLWGAQAVPLAEEDLAAALRSGEVDAAEGNLPTYVDSGYYRLAPYWVYDRHAYNADVLVASSQTMGLLSAEERKLIADFAAEAAAWQREHWMNAEVRAMMHASRSGCYMMLMDDTEAARFRAAAQPLYDSLTAQQQQIVEAAGRLADPPGA